MKMNSDFDWPVDWMAKDELALREYEKECKRTGWQTYDPANWAVTVRGKSLETWEQTCLARFVGSIGFGS